MAFFTPFKFVTLCQFHKEKRRVFAYMAASAYHVISKEVKNYVMIHNWIFRQTCCINNPHWQFSGIMIFLCKRYILISETLVGSFLDVLFLLLAAILSGFYDQDGIKIELLKKVHRKICERDITFWTARPPFYVTFCCSLHLLPSPSQVTYLLNGPYKDTWVVFCIMKSWVNGRKYGSL